MPSLNVDLLNFTVDFLQRNEQAHDQGVWFAGEINCSETGRALAEKREQNVCQTTGCVAGWASLFAGYHQLRSVEFDETGDRISVGDDEVVDETGEVLDMRSAGAIALGLADDQASVMFAGHREIAGIAAMRDLLIANPDAEALQLIDAAREAEELEPI